MQGAETTNVHPGLRIQDHEQGTLRSVCLAVDSRRVTLTRAEEGSTRRDRPTHQVVRRTTYEVVRGQDHAAAAAGPFCAVEQQRLFGASLSDRSPGAGPCRSGPGSGLV